MEAEISRLSDPIRRRQSGTVSDESNQIKPAAGLAPPIVNGQGSSELLRFPEDTDEAEERYRPLTFDPCHMTDPARCSAQPPSGTCELRSHSPTSSSDQSEVRLMLIFLHHHGDSVIALLSDGLRLMDDL
ncbi:unnamed protein product [Pleuronectes platessa]|uniref:Uncharacterized protein n=1 Tax=Pleuronectes platessa TaxID=8262 RepID=A0A9N7VY11_PLEPL|nr:unnamed protein product [Pleuronectes platessa]